MTPYVKIMGIDPGLASFGVALVEVRSEPALVDVRVFTSDASAQKRGVAKSDDRFRRARDLARFLSGAIDECAPDMIAVEAMSWPRGAHAIASIALSWGVIASNVGRRAVVQAQPRSWRKAIHASGSEADAHAVLIGRPGVASMIDGFKKSDRPHALDALGVAVWAVRTDEFAAIAAGRGL